MTAAKTASAKAAAFIRQNYRHLIPMYVLCQLFWWILQTLIQAICTAAENGVLSCILPQVGVFVAFLFIYKRIEHYKNKYTPFANSPTPLSTILPAALLYTAANAVALLAIPFPYLYQAAMAITFCINALLVPFFIFVCLTGNRGLRQNFQKTGRLLQQYGFDFIKLLLLLVLLYLLSVAIVRLPSQALFEFLLTNGASLFWAETAKNAAAILCTIIGIVPMYTDLKLYIAMFFLFSQERRI